MVSKENLTQEEANEEVTQSCSCREGLSYRIECEIKGRREENIEKLCDRLKEFFEFCKKKSGETRNEAFEQLKEIGISVMDEKIGKVKIDWKQTTLAISMNGKGEIVLGWTYKEKEQRKI